MKIHLTGRGSRLVVVQGCSTVQTEDMINAKAAGDGFVPSRMRSVVAVLFLGASLVNFDASPAKADSDQEIGWHMYNACLKLQSGFFKIDAEDKGLVAGWNFRTHTARCWQSSDWVDAMIRCGHEGFKYCFHLYDRNGLTKIGKMEQRLWRQGKPTSMARQQPRRPNGIDSLDLLNGAVEMLGTAVRNNNTRRSNPTVHRTLPSPPQQHSPSDYCPDHDFKRGLLISVVSEAALAGRMNLFGPPVGARIFWSKGNAVHCRQTRTELGG